MKPIDAIPAGVAAMLLGATLVVASGNSFAAHTGLILFCYGAFVIGGTLVKKFFS